MGSAGIVLRKLLVCKVWISVRSFDQGPVLVEDEIEDSMLYLHELSKNTRYLVHVLPRGVAFDRELSAVRISDYVSMIGCYGLEACAAGKESLRASLVAREVVW